MSWNEPGGGKGGGKDPWGGRNDQGPPDLDEVIKKLQDKVNQFFGGSGKGSGNGSGKGGDSLPTNPAPIIAIIALVLAVLLIWSSAYQVQQAERALVLRTGKFHSIQDAGLKFKFPVIDQVMKVNVQAVRAMSLEASMLTADNNLVTVSLMVQYQVADPRSYLLQVSQPESALRHATESAMRQVVGGMNMDAVITEQRQLVASEVKRLLQESLNRFKTGILLSEVSLQGANPPQAVKAAFDDVIKAREDETRLRNEAEAYANGIIPVARGLARRQLEEAEGYKQAVIAQAEGEADRFSKLLTAYSRAPSVTRKRMYLETMEEVYSNVSKVMVDVQGGNNILYLPLDRMMGQERPSQVDARKLTEEVLNESSKQGAATRKANAADKLRDEQLRRREIR